MSFSTYASGFSTANNIAFDISNNLYVINNNYSTSSYTIIKVDTLGNQTTLFTYSYAILYIVFDNVGYLHILTIGLLHKIDTDGNVFLPPITILFGTIGGMVYDNNDNLFISYNELQFGFGNSIYKLDSIGNQTLFINGSSGYGTNGLSWPYGLTFDNNGNLYIANAYTPNPSSDVLCISKYDSNGYLLNSSFINLGLNVSFTNLIFDSSNNVYVSYINATNVGINKYDIHGNFISVVYSAPYIGFVDPFVTNSILGLAFDSSGNLYFTSDDRTTVTKYIPPPPTVPVSNVCFPAGTPIKTDQGIVPIEKINPEHHTIHCKKVVAITKTVTSENYLLCFDKNSLGKNCPSDKTIMTREHKICFKGKMMEAYKFLDYNENVYKVNYTGEILYNVLMEGHEKINVNNIVCETLHPKNIIAKLYTNNFDSDYKDNLVVMVNQSIMNKDFSTYKKLINRI